MSGVKKPEAMITAFRVFDPDYKGYVTVAEFRKIMGRLGANPLPADNVDEMVAYAGEGAPVRFCRRAVHGRAPCRLV